MCKLEVVADVAFGCFGAHGTQAVSTLVEPACETDEKRPTDAKSPSTSSFASVASH